MDFDFGVKLFSEFIGTACCLSGFAVVNVEIKCEPKVKAANFVIK